MECLICLRNKEPLYKTSSFGEQRPPNTNNTIPSLLRNAFYIPIQSSPNCFIFKYKNDNYSAYDFKPSSYEHYLPVSWLSITAYELTNVSMPIKLIHIKSKNNSNQTTIIYSHGFTTSIDSIYNELITLSTSLKVDVISYDYIPYETQRNKSTPKIKKWLSSILSTVLSFSLTHLNIKINDCILTSYSLGSIPTLELALNNKYKLNVIGIILLQPVLCDLNLTTGHKATNVERYKFRTRLTKIESYVMVVHAKKDQEVQYEFTQEMCKNIKNCIAYFPKNGTRGNLFLENRTKLLKRINNFISMVKGYDVNINMSQLNEMMDVSKTADTDNSYFQFGESNWTFPCNSKLMTSFDGGEIIEQCNMIGVGGIDEEDAEYLYEEKNIMM